MKMEKDCLGNRLWKWKGTVWATAYGNGRGLFGQPLMEMEEDCLDNRLWKWKRTVWATVLGNLFKLPKTICNCFGQPLMEMEVSCLSNRFR
jgi:hypothetical protein